MAPGGGEVVTQDVHFRQRGVGFGEGRVEADGFKKQSESFLGLEGHAVQLRQMVIRLGVGGLAEDPGTLLFDVRLGLAIQGEIDDFFAPETRSFDPTRIKRTSITLVLVGPVMIRSPRGSK